MAGAAGAIPYGRERRGGGDGVTRGTPDPEGRIKKDAERGGLDDKNVAN